MLDDDYLPKSTSAFVKAGTSKDGAHLSANVVFAEVTDAVECSQAVVNHIILRSWFRTTNNIFNMISDKTI